MPTRPTSRLGACRLCGASVVDSRQGVLILEFSKTVVLCRRPCLALVERDLHASIGRLAARHRRAAEAGGQLALGEVSGG